jgi:hypothetical protein
VILCLARRQLATNELAGFQGSGAFGVQLPLRSVEPFKPTILRQGRPGIVRPWSGTEHYVERARECPSFNL